MPDLPTTPRARRPRREEVRRRLLDAATEVFTRQGIDGASLDDVAAAAGLTKGAIYSNFAGKDGLIYALMDAHIAQRERAVTQLLAGANDPAEAARRIGDALAAAVRAEADWQRLFLEFVLRTQRDPRLAAEFAARRADARSRLSDLIAAAAQRHGFALRLTPQELAVTLLALSNGLAIERLAQPEGVGDDLFARLLGLVLPGDQR